MHGGCRRDRSAAYHRGRASATACCPAESSVGSREAADRGRVLGPAGPAVLVQLATGSTTYLGTLEQMADQPIGEPVSQWSPPPRPLPRVLRGRYCRLEPLDRSRHARPLWDAYALDSERRNWTYLTHGPYDTFESFVEWVNHASSTADPLFFAIVDSSSRAVGVASYLRIHPEAGTIEVGHINMSPLLQRTVAATEAMFLMMQLAFVLGYRRYEWKCDALNAPSRAAAERLGFTFEGIFRQALIYKGRNRDTAWYSILDREWPWLRDAFEDWLAPENFDGAGRQRVRLSDLVNSARISRKRI
jgi:RimJ/RimL family protein N-acetyltransferase